MVSYNIVIVGAGGTGSNLIARLAQFIASLNMKKTGTKSVNVSIIDGDTVSPRNLERQNFCEFDVLQNKADVMQAAVSDAYHLSWNSYGRFIDSADELSRVFSYSGNSDNNSLNVLIGCCDNHRCRQVMEEWFASQKNGIYIDAANEFSVGEVVIGIRADGKTISPSRKYYFPDIMTDTRKSKSEQSCGTVNMSAPQHIATNCESANTVLAVVAKLLVEHKVSGGIIYFDTFSFNKVFREWKGGVCE